MWEERLARLEDIDEIPEGEGLSGAWPAVAERLGSLYRVLAILAVLVLILLAWRARRRRVLSSFPVLLERGFLRLGWKPPSFLRRWAKRARLGPLERAYIEVDQALMRLGAAPAPADTPAERTATLAYVLPAVAEPAHRLLVEYHSATYSPHRYSVLTAQEAARRIRKLSWIAKLRRFLGRE
jgi:hypothetical protein